MKTNLNKEQNAVKIKQTINDFRDEMWYDWGNDYRFDRIEQSMMETNDKGDFNKLEDKFDIIYKAKQRTRMEEEGHFEILTSTFAKIEEMDQEPKPKTRERDNSQSM